MIPIHMNSSDSLNCVLHELDVSYKREKMLRSIISELFMVVCRKLSEEEIKDLKCLTTVQKLARGEID